MPAPTLERLKARREAVGIAPGSCSEVTRICDLPIRSPMSEEDLEAFQRTHILARAYDDGFRFWRIQAEAIRAYEETGGLFGAIGVGWGKTLITQVIADLARRKGIRKIVLLVPPEVVPQLVQIDFPSASTKVPLSYQLHVLAGRNKRDRKTICSSNRSGLYVFPYSLLSQPDGEDNLRRIDPKLVICDEAHNLANLTRSARARRLMAFVADNEPEGVCVSGTMTGKSIMDYYHLIKWCLGTSSPLPNTKHVANEWAEAIDSTAIVASRSGPLAPLVKWAKANYPKEEVTEDLAGFRKAYKLRLRSTPGVVSSGDASVGASLIIHNSPVNGEGVEGFDQIQALMKQVVNDMKSPDGDEIDHAMHAHRWLNELSGGFYNRLTWPDEHDLAQRLKRPVREVREVLDLAKVQYSVKQEYHSTMRRWISQRGGRNMDTPLLVTSDMARFKHKHVGRELYQIWCDSHDMDDALTEAVLEAGMHPGSPRELAKKVARSLREAEFIRVCPYKVNAAVEWAAALKKSEGGVIWVWHQGLGQWVYELLCARLGRGRILHCPAGDESNVEILRPENGKKIAVASLAAHGTGKNLQHWHQQYYLQWPRSAKLAEQSLGRTHRNGQKASEVWAHTNHSLPFDRGNFGACLTDACYIHQTTGNRQKLIYGTYSPEMPKIASPLVLRERGYQNHQLTAEQLRFMRERFGSLEDN